MRCGLIFENLTCRYTFTMETSRGLAAGSKQDSKQDKTGVGLPSRWPKAKPLYFPPPSSSPSPKPIESLPADLRPAAHALSSPHRSERNRRRIQSTPRRARSLCRDPLRPTARRPAAGSSCGTYLFTRPAARAPNWGWDPLPAEAACGVGAFVAVFCAGLQLIFPCVCFREP